MKNEIIIKPRKIFVLSCLSRNLLAILLFSLALINFNKNILILIPCILLISLFMQNTLLIFQLYKKTVFKADSIGIHTSLTYDNLTIKWQDIKELSISSGSKRDTTVDAYHSFTHYIYTYLVVRTNNYSHYYIPIHMHDSTVFSLSVCNYSTRKFIKTLKSIFADKLHTIDLLF